jgi:uncharacterized SAM-binding protein YcdF (DUF218 family)
LQSDQAIGILWNYLSVSHPLEPSDLIVGFGSYDRDTARRAAALYLAGWAPVLLFSGGLGKGTEGFFERPEADVYADIALEMGVPKEAILLENRSTNSGENIAFTRALLERQNLRPRRLTVVHKPYMGRRVYAALCKQWPQVEARIAPSRQTWQAHLASALAQGTSREEVLCSMVGDFQRMELYAQLGYQTEQPKPPEAIEAFDVLARAGYDRYL